MLGRGESISCLQIHDYVTHGEESFVAQWLCEEVGEIICGSHEGHDDSEVFDLFAYEEMTPVDILCARMVLWVVREIASGLIIHGHVGGLLVCAGEL